MLASSAETKRGQPGVNEVEEAEAEEEEDDDEEEEEE